MQKLLLTVLAAAFCGGCGHQDLRAPCTDDVASLGFAAGANVPCDRREPVNADVRKFSPQWRHRP